ncbi:hypothetical protein MMC06_001898 [Schaereria dolodes]|nr:hypothetical protein [Schaereria dolodes]
MSQNFNNFNGVPENHGDNTFGGLSNSLIFPNPTFQQNFQQGWPTSPNWQANGQNAYNMGSMFPRPMMGSNGYFPVQQDYFDEGDDFYDNADEETPADQDHQEIAVASTGTHVGSFSDKQLPMRNPTTVSGLATPNTRQLENLQARTQAAEKTPSKSNDPVVADRLAALRAKLMSRSTGGKTPTPEAKETKTGENGGVSINIQDQDKKQTEQPEQQKERRQAWQLQPRTTNNKDLVADKKDDIDTTNNENSAAGQADSNIDIDALLDETKAEMAEKKKNTNKATVPKEQNRARNNAQLKEKAVKSSQAVEPQPKLSIESRRQSVAGSNISSEASEQGEIREDHAKTERMQIWLPLEPVQSNDLAEKASLGKREQPRPLTMTPTTNKQQPKKIDTTLANRRVIVDSADDTKPKSPVISAQTPSTAKPIENREAAPPYDRKEKSGRGPVQDPERSSHNRRQDSDRERPREPHGRERQYEGRQYPKYRNPIEETERAAAEYKRKLQMARVEPREVVASTPTSEAKVQPDRQVVEYFEDAEEWLEMTGYNDLAYRKKALARQRKLIELDKERAELEREAQNEYEERSYISRAQSMMPRESVEGRPKTSAFSPQIIRAFPSLSMPPPPVPVKDNPEDVGIKIKDLATRESLQESPTTITPSLKRQYPDDDTELGVIRPVDKQARTDSKDYSFDKQAQHSPISIKQGPLTLESRISVDDGTFKREYRGRSRSPDFRRRSISPFARRVSGTDVHLRRQDSGGSHALRNGYSPNRRPGLSRETSPERRDELQYDEYRSNYESRSNAGYEPYQSTLRGGYYNQNQSTNYRGRGRGRGGYGNTRGGNFSRSFKDPLSK